MLAFDLAVEFTVGAVFALAHRERLVDREVRSLEDRAFRNGLLYSGVLYVASAMFFLVGWPAWNSMYLFDIQSSPILLSWFAYLDCAALLASYIVGYLYAVSWLRRAAGHTSPLLLRLCGLWLLVSVLLFIVLWQRSFTVASYEEFVSYDWQRFEIRWGEKHSFFGHALMYWLLVWMFLDFGPLVLIYRESRIAAGVTRKGRLEFEPRSGKLPSAGFAAPADPRDDQLRA